MIYNARRQAFIDMTSEGLSVQFIVEEKAILEFTATELSVRVDFRKFNGGHNKKNPQ